MAKVCAKSSRKVCLLSPHPMVIDGFRRLLSESGFQIIVRQLEFMLAPDLRYLEIPRASVYVIDAYAQRLATAALVGNIHDHISGARMLVVGGNLKEADSYTLLRQGIKGILNYTEAHEQLPGALALVASGRLLGASQAAFTLRRFHPEHCARSTHGRRLASELSRREEEVLAALLGPNQQGSRDRLHTSERTDENPMSPICSPNSVCDAAQNLILLCYQTRYVIDGGASSDGSCDRATCEEP